MNKYERQPEKIIDLHGYTKQEAGEVLEGLILAGEYRHVRIITGKGLFRGTGPILREYVKSVLRKHDVRFETAKLYNGGEGALEVYFK